MIKVILKNGRKVKWEKKQYDDYKYDGKCFIIIKKKDWIAFYNMDAVISVIIK